MKSLSRKGSTRPKPHMNVTPLVDVVLVLLIIFMVVIPAMEKAAQVDVPSILNVDEGSRHRVEPYTLSVVRDGRLFFENEELPAVGFEDRLRVAHAADPARKLVLRADVRGRWQDVRRVFRAVQDVGFPGISLRVAQRGGGSSAGEEE